MIRVLCLSVALCLGSVGAAAENWAQWRGPDQVGRSETAAGLPSQWSQTDNVIWRVELSGWSAATPIIWGDIVFVTASEEGFNSPPQAAKPDAPRRRGGSSRPESTGHNKMYLLALRRADGSTIWKAETGDGNRVYRKQNLTSPSPVTDGEHVWVMTGAGDLSCFDFQGKRIWHRNIQDDYGEFGLNWGYASSPKLHEDKLFVQVLHGMLTDDPSYVLAIDKKTGKTLWKVDRPTDAPRESPDNYATPILIEAGGELQLVVSGGDYATGHDIDTGKELWRMGGFNPQSQGAYRTIAS